METLRFDGRCVIVTGAGRGIGRAHALLLGARGASVVVNDVGAATPGTGSSQDPADEIVAAIAAAGGTAIASYVSVAADTGPDEIVATALDNFGRVDALVNNAGNAIPKPFEDLTDEDFAAIAAVHIGGTRRLCRAVWPRFTEAGYGRIVNTVSSAMLGLPNWSAYGAAKGSLLGFTLNLATEARGHGIGVNAISPGAGTRMLLDSADTVPPGAVEAMMASMPPSLVASGAAFLVHESCTLNGVVLGVSGGKVSRMVVAHTAGIHRAELTPEDIACNLEEILEGPLTVAGSPG
jgi:NAD(P)-dependent dehydrogenase (short-subunit alcohol dehydrogenase family)